MGTRVLRKGNVCDMVTGRIYDDLYVKSEAGFDRTGPGADLRMPPEDEIKASASVASSDSANSTSRRLVHQ